MLINDLATLRMMVDAYLKRGRRVAFDIETTGLHPRLDTLIALQFMQEGREPVIVDMRKLEAREVGRIIRPLFSGPLLVCGHHLKFDLSFLLCQMGIRATRIFDTYLADVVLHSADPAKKYALDKVVQQRGIQLAFPMNKADREWFINLHQREEEWHTAFPARQITYMENDVKAILPIMDQQQEALEHIELTETAQLEFNVCLTLVKLETDGVPIDVAGWRAEIEKHREKAACLEKEILALVSPSIRAHYSQQINQAQTEYNNWKAREKQEEMRLKQEWQGLHTGLWANNDTDEHFKWGDYRREKMREWRANNPAPTRLKQVVININSQPQLLIAFRRLGIPADDTSEKTLAKLEGKHLVIGLLRAYRKEMKFVTAYGDGLLAECDPVTGRFHFSYNQMVQTGRMSASRIQQIPKKGEGQKLREQVKAGPGNILITCDYPAIEMRILAEISQEERLIDIFCEGKDIHSEIARQLFNLGDDVDPKKELAKAADGRLLGKTCREIAKTVEYASVYGTGPRGLADLLGCSVDDAKNVLADFFETYPRIDAWLKHIKKQALREYETRTLGGRARFYKVPKQPDDEADAEERRAYREEIASIERAAGNAPIQGSNADMTKQALVKLYNDLERRGWLDRVFFVAAVHDEIVLEAPQEIAEQVAEVLAGAMEDGAKKYLKRVPVSCRDYDIGPCWHKV